MNYQDVVISDLIEWHVLLLGGLAFIGYVIYSWVRTAPHNKEAGINTMADSKIKSLFSSTPKAETAGTKSVALSEVLGTQLDTKRSSAETHRAAADRLSQEATARTELASKEDQQAAALEQARTILEQAGL